ALRMGAALFVLGRTNDARETGAGMPILLEGTRTIGIDVADVIDFLTHFAGIPRDVVVNTAEGRISPEVRMVSALPDFVLTADDMREVTVSEVLTRIPVSVVGVSALISALFAGINSAGTSFISVAHSQSPFVVTNR